MGSKWGIPLRAPDIWDELLKIGGAKWEPLGALSEVQYGIKTGADKFFYVTDFSEGALEAFPDHNAFHEHFGVPRNKVANGNVKIVKSGFGEAFPIESHFLKPVVHSLMHIDSYYVDERQCVNLVLMVNQPLTALKSTFLFNYLKWGEKQGVPSGSSVRQRAETGRNWYDLTWAEKAPLLWVKERQYRFVAPTNDANVYANCRLYTLHDKSEQHDAMAAVLNSSLVVLATLMHGRPVGVEANWSTMIVDVAMMLVPRWSDAKKKVRARLINAFQRMKRRSVLGFLSEQRLRRKALLEAGRISEIQNYPDVTELDQSDRQDLDDAVLELIGVSDPQKRKELRAHLYAFLEDHFEALRRKEERAIDNKAKAKKNTKITPQLIAADVIAQIESQRPVLLRGYRDIVKFADGEPRDGIHVPSVGTPQIVDDMLNVGVSFMRSKKRGELIKTRSRSQAELVLRLVALGETGRHHFIPITEAAVAAAVKAIEEQVKRRNIEVRALIAERTQDPELQDRTFAVIMSRL